MAYSRIRFEIQNSAMMTLVQPTAGSPKRIGIAELGYRLNTPLNLALGKGTVVG